MENNWRSKLMRFNVPEVYIDLGTANTLVYLSNKGLIVNEPSYLTYRTGWHGAQSPLAVGTSAKRMLGRTPKNLEVVRPLSGGVIADFHATKSMMWHWLKPIFNKRFIRKPELIISLPCKVTDFERKTIADLGTSMGSPRVYLLDEPMAAAVGEGMPIETSEGSLVVDIGGGTTEIALIALNGIVYSKALRIGGYNFDRRIMDYIRSKFNFVIGELTAERIKIEGGSAVPQAASSYINIIGIDLNNGVPKPLAVSTHDIHLAIEPEVRAILSAIKETLAAIPVEFSEMILAKGMLLTGGGALLKDLAQRINMETNVQTTVSLEPLLSVAKGGIETLKNRSLRERVTISA